MPVSDSIHEKLTKGLAPQRLEVIDESHLHAGHASAPEGGESHFRLLIVSAAFEGLSRVARQRLVNGLLSEELSGPVHALAMKTLTPDEAAAA
ncbi:BolA family protein [Hyphococcus luteus]|uniref:BolA family transcriptional regulator n=1 Tax=Hyphococcus luteus TaxID=2058213 RepID=A0A2S7JZA4_9PROT|nr:BolA family protein [Marinicaulis flavus]PQA85528.1 BolA family transcriptional regulator [Marinicaulis flavus]